MQSNYINRITATNQTDTLACLVPLRLSSLIPISLAGKSMSFAALAIYSTESFKETDNLPSNTYFNYFLNIMFHQFVFWILKNRVVNIACKLSTCFRQKLQTINHVYVCFVQMFSRRLIKFQGNSEFSL